MRKNCDYPIRQLVNWYVGNYCVRKCFDNDKRFMDHLEKLKSLVEKSPGFRMTHRDFLDLFNDCMTVCTLDDSFKRKSIGWKLFTTLRRIPNYKSEMVIIKDNWLARKDGPLQEPGPRCPVCIRCGAPD